MEVKIARIKKGLSQTQLSNETGICRTILSKIENGNYSSLRYETMNKLSKALDTTPQKLFFSNEQ
ncbi:helix-turn-helix transcriptional regulator [Clostridium botulinum]|uniref:helix-turn-helix domain-containing protein n=1 Tax=Clostridium cagae TaxID=2080751 RepID=UPI0013C5F13F|nr:helix-turn-helix transcriptional regulator [Clostridium botulinum]NFN47088.1 helix-turn-helix transcriptional regulator [Clostridium botulinum]